MSAVKSDYILIGTRALLSVVPVCNSECTFPYTLVKRRQKCRGAGADRGAINSASSPPHPAHHLRQSNIKEDYFLLQKIMAMRLSTLYAALVFNAFVHYYISLLKLIDQTYQFHILESQIFIDTCSLIYIDSEILIYICTYIAQRHSKW